MRSKMSRKNVIASSQTNDDLLPGDRIDDLAHRRRRASELREIAAEREDTLRDAGCRRCRTPALRRVEALVDHVGGVEVAVDDHVEDRPEQEAFFGLPFPGELELEATHDLVDGNRAAVLGGVADREQPAGPDTRSISRLSKSSFRNSQSWTATWKYSPKRMSFVRCCFGSSSASTTTGLSSSWLMTLSRSSAGAPRRRSRPTQWSGSTAAFRVVEVDILVTGFARDIAPGSEHCSETTHAGDEVDGTDRYHRIHGDELGGVDGRAAAGPGARLAAREPAGRLGRSDRCR